MNPSDIMIVCCGLFALLLLLASSMPVAFSMGIVGVVGFALAESPRAALGMLGMDLVNIAQSYDLTVIPLFVFMGQIAFHSGISGRLFNAAYHWLGWARGGMAMSTVGACAAFGAICGSGPATAATMATVALPEMKKIGYDDALSAGTVAAAGGLGMLIPPSVVFIVYGILAEQSIGKLFIAGVLPGIMVAFLFCLVIFIKCFFNPKLGPAAPSTTWKAKFKSLFGVIEMILLFGLVMGGMFCGFFTPNEGAAVGAVGSVLIAAARGRCSLYVLWRSAQETLRTSCMVLVIVACATCFGHFLAVTRMPSVVAAALASLQLPHWTVMFIIILFYFISGCFIDSLALIMLTVPIFFPVVVKVLGYDPIWFGVMIVLITQMGVITPPVGVNVYVVGGIDRRIPLPAIFRGSIPYLLALAAAALLIGVFPEIVLWLPGHVK